MFSPRILHQKQLLFSNLKPNIQYRKIEFSHLDSLFNPAGFNHPQKHNQQLKKRTTIERRINQTTL